MNRRRFSLAAAVLLAGCKSSSGGEVEVTVMAAASLRRVAPKLAEAFASRHPRVKVSMAYGASGDLRKRVQDGAPADAVLMANDRPVQQLIESGHVDAASRVVVASNKLILIGPSGAPPLTFETVDRLPAGDKLAIGDPGAVPAGEYARDALRNLGKWKAMKGRMVYAGDVSAVLAYARRGEVAAAVVYDTEIQGIDDVVMLDVAKGDWAPTPQVVVGLVKDSPQREQASRLLQFLAGPEGQAIFRAHGFGHR